MESVEKLKARREEKAQFRKLFAITNSTSSVTPLWKLARVWKLCCCSLHFTCLYLLAHYMNINAGIIRLICMSTIQTRLEYEWWEMLALQQQALLPLHFFIFYFPNQTDKYVRTLCKPKTFWMWRKGHKKVAWKHVVSSICSCLKRLQLHKKRKEVKLHFSKTCFSYGAQYLHYIFSYLFSVSLWIFPFFSPVSI